MAIEEWKREGGPMSRTGCQTAEEENQFIFDTLFASIEIFIFS